MALHETTRKVISLVLKVIDVIMKYAYTILFAVLALGSCSKEQKQLVDLSQPIGDTIASYDPENKDSVYLVVTDTIHRNDTIFSETEVLTCNVYDSLKDVIHKGENCRTNNSSAIAIAKANGNTQRVENLNQMNKIYELRGVRAKVELPAHIANCNTCRKLKNK